MNIVQQNLTEPVYQLSERTNKSNKAGELNSPPAQRFG